MPLLTTQSARGYGWSAVVVAAIIPTYHQIATTLSPGTSSYTFSAIPSGYDHLELRYFAKDNRTPVYSNMSVQLNGDTAANYFSLNPQVDARAGSPFGGENTGSTNIANPPIAGSSNQNYWGSGTIKILDCSNTSKNKVALFTGGYVGFGDGTSEQGIITQGIGQWRNTASVTSMTIVSSSGSFQTGTRFSLYGIKGA